MEFAARADLFPHKRFFLLDFLHELSDELYLLVLLAKNIPLSSIVLSDELCLFLCNSDSDNSADSIE